MRFKLQTVFVSFLLYMLIYYAESQEITTEEIFIDDENNHTWTSTNFPQPYLPDSKTLIVKVNPGYTILVIITELDLDSENGDFLVIKAGTTLNDENKGKVFTYHLKSVVRYMIESNNATMSFRVMGKNEVGKKGFSLIYKREGIVVTTEVPVTEVTWPTPSETDHIYFTGNVSGRNQNDYENETVVNDFKNAVAQMATQYCIAENISFRENITELNVHIKTLIGCPYEWPNSDICVKIRFSVPIFLNEDANSTEYQLSSENLALMWQRYGNEFLNKISLSIYDIPDTSSKLTIWLIISCVVLIIFILVILVVKKTTPHVSPLKMMKRRNSDMQGIVKNEMRESNLSLSPHLLQVIPPLFEIDCTFSSVEPDIREPSKQYSDSSDDESENEITISKFSNSRNNIIDNDKIESTT